MNTIEIKDVQFPGWSKKRRAYKSNSARSQQETRYTSSVAPAYIVAYLDAKKVLKTLALSLGWKELSW